MGEKIKNIPQEAELLNEEQLDQVSGGVIIPELAECIKCGKIIPKVLYNVTGGYCRDCKP